MSATSTFRLHTAQSLLDLPGGVSSIEFNVDDPFEAESVAQAIAAQTGLEADSWIRTNEQFFSALSAQTLSNTFIRFFVGLTAALGIASVLVVSVVQKSREIGILRAMGTTQGQVLRVFLVQGAVMGLVGSLFGSVLGFLLPEFLAQRRPESGWYAAVHRQLSTRCCLSSPPPVRRWSARWRP